MTFLYLTGVGLAVLLFLWWATKPGTDDVNGGLQTKQKPHNDSMI